MGNVIKQEIIMSTTKIALSLILLFISFGCSKSNPEIFIEELNWHIVLPPNFEEQNSSQIKEQRRIGKEMIEKSYGKEATFHDIKLFSYKEGKYNSINAQYIKMESANNFMSEFKRANEIVEKVFREKRPNSKIDVNYSTKIIDGLEFQYCEMVTDSGKDNSATFVNLSHIFDDKKLDILLVFKEREEGELMLDSILKSKFES